MAKETEVTYFCDICETQMPSAVYQFEARWVHASHGVTFDVCEECREHAVLKMPGDKLPHESIFMVVRKLFKKGRKKNDHREN